jgi:penicillin-binding protein 2
VAEPEALGSHNVGLDKKYMRFIRDGLYLVVNGPQGTATRAKIPGVDVAGKTGTSQVVKLKEGEGRIKDLSKIEEKYRDHAWFVAYAPVDNPKIAIAVLVEHGGHGGSTSAPIAKEVISAYLEDMVKKPAQKPQQVTAPEIPKKTTAPEPRHG